MVSVSRYASDWCAYVAAGIVALALCCAIEVDASPHHHKTVGDAHQGQAKASITTAEQKPAPYHLPEDCNRPKSDSEANLCTAIRAADATKEQAHWAKLTYIVAAIGTVFVLLTLAANAAAAWYANRAVAAANETLNHSRATAERQLRAYVVVGGMAYQRFAVGKQPRVALSIKNGGQTPAKNVQFFGACSIQVTGVPHKFRFKKIERRTDIGAGQEQPYFINMTEDMNVVRYNALMDGGATCIVGGYLSYKDVFGITRRTMFRGIFEPRMVEGETAVFVVDNRHVRSS